MPNKYIAIALIALALLAGSGWGGWAVRGWKDDSANLKAVQQARNEERLAARKQAEASQKTLEKLQAAKAKTRIIYREVAKIENRDAPCFDAHDLVLLNAAAQGIAPGSDPVP